MGDEIQIANLNIKSQRIKDVITTCDQLHGEAGIAGALTEKEVAFLQNALNGGTLKAELAAEDDSIKSLFGYKETTNVDRTTPTSDDKSTTSKQTKSNSKTPLEQAKDAYYKYRNIDPISRKPIEYDSEGKPVAGLSPEKAYEAVKHDFKGNKELEKALKDLRKYSIDAESVHIALDALKQSNSANPKQRKKDAEAYMKANGTWDDHTKAALNGNNHSWWSNTFNWLSGRDSNMKKIRKAQAYGVNAEKVAEQTYTKKDFTDAIGKKCPLFKEDENGIMAIQKVTFDGQPLVTKEDGKFNIENLSRFISRSIGSDNTLSRQENAADAELEEIRTFFAKKENGGIKLTKRDTKQLVEFCGYHVERKNLALAAYDGTVGAVTAAAGTGVALATQAREIVRGKTNIHDHLEFNLEFTNNNSRIDMEKLYADEKIKKLIDNGSLQFNNTTMGLQIIVDEKDTIPFMHIASKHIGLNMLKSAGVGAAMGVLESMLNFGPSEKDIFSTRFECTTYEDFIETIDARKNLTDAEKMALKQIALQFINETKDKDGNTVPLETTRTVKKRDKNGKEIFETKQVPKTNAEGKEVKDTNGNTVMVTKQVPVMEEVPAISWDCCGFKEYLNRKAGFSSNLNEVELLNDDKKPESPQPTVEKPTVEKPTVEKPTVEKPPVEKPTVEKTPVENRPDCETKTETEKVKVNIPTTRFNKWDDLANGYSCLQRPEFTKGVRISNSNKYTRLNNRMMKVVQAMDTTKITTQEEANTFYNINKIAEFTEDAIKYGINKAIEKHPDFPINKDEYNKFVNADAGIKGNVYVPDLYDPENDDTCGWTKTKTKVTDRSGHTSAKTSTKTSIKDGETTYWKKCQGDTDWTSIKKSEYDEIQEAKKKQAAK